ncbi:hypothetical protein [Streptomyces sp. HUAS TT7]|uniref:hypothetical protein n=1 Tax=Streptomyces sp. HUAS TT7 TaxID=3447507 RepID=UPI003F65F4F5
MRLTAKATGLGVATVALIATVSPATAAASAPTTPAAGQRLSCTETHLEWSRNTLWRTVSGTLDGAGHPGAVTVTRTRTGAVDVSTINPTLIPGFASGYYERTHGWSAWLLGTQYNGFDTYYLLMPSTVPGGAFDAELLVQFGPNGNQGSNDFTYSCSAN